MDVLGEDLQFTNAFTDTHRNYQTVKFKKVAANADFSEQLSKTLVGAKKWPPKILTL